MTSTHGFSIVNADNIEWRNSDVAHGVKVKNLGSSAGQRMQLVSFAPGAHFPHHKHTGPEFIYVLAGEVTQCGRRLGPGFVGIAAKDTEEDDFHSLNGGTFLLVYSE